jgi:hypothetical protein
MKCGYNKCLFDGEVDKETAIKVGNKYYHKECHKQMQNKQDTRVLYLEKVNPSEVVKNLNSVINNIIEVKKVDSGLLLFALKYAINNNFKINSPYGLHYIVNNYTIKNEYQKYLGRQQKQDVSEVQTVEGSKFKVNVEKSDLWSKITNG